MIDPAAINFVTAAREHCAAQAGFAGSIALVEQMRRVEKAAHDERDANKAMARLSPDECERLFPGTSLERLTRIRVTEEIAFDRACEALGLDMQWRVGL